ncbi:MAG: NAD(P)-binding protein [Candidatus Lokiarchaeota archaeon]|nr:NAD(P)-binding protein [Candidatus Lokiarchaeota archaeon]MBD3339801.1 NAD(P)-binding protein [Candidatus Lokiarchaeota archaeon]
MKAVIIGSGLSGLTAGALMAQKGHHVIIFEQHGEIGGVTATMEKDGYKWDWGQMLVPELSEGEAGRKILKKLGISERVKVIKGYRENYFPDFTIRRPEDYLGREWRKKSFKRLFPEDAKGIDRYYKIYERIHDLSSMFNKKGFINKLKLLIKFLPLIRKKNWSAQELMDYCFSNEQLQAVFTGILADYVISPQDFPGLIIPIINAESQYDERIPLDYEKHEHRPSWTFIIGGCVELVNALASACKSFGGNIITNTAISKIDVSNNKVKGVITSDGQEFEADVIIASGGAKELFYDLVGEQYLPDEFVETYINDLYTTESVFMVHLGVDYDPSIHQNNAALCYYYLSYDIQKSIDECIEGTYHEGEHGFLAFIPSKYSPNMAPSGKHAISIYTIAPNTPINGNWEDDKEKWAEKLLDIAERFIPGLRKHEQTREIITPLDFKKRTYLKKHAFGGTVPHLKIPPPPHKTPINGLWFIGAQSETYGGVTGAMTGAENVVEIISQETYVETTKQSFKSLSK